MRKMSGATSAVAVPFPLTDPFPFADDETPTCGANAVIAAAAMCLQIRPSCAMRTWKSGQVHEPVPISKRSEEHTSELQSRRDLVCRLLLEKKKRNVSSCDNWMNVTGRYD